MAPHSSTLAWKIPWMEEPGGLQSMGSLRVGLDWATSLSLFTFMHWRRKWQPTPIFLLRESQGWGSLVGCRLWGHTVGHDWSNLAAAAPRSVECVFSGSQSPPLSIFIARLSINRNRSLGSTKNVIITIFLNFSKLEKAITLQSSRLNQRGQDLLDGSPCTLPFLSLCYVLQSLQAPYRSCSF